MTAPADPRIMAHATIEAPPGMQITGPARVNLYLRRTADGRYRWFREDGSSTVVDAATVERATRAAQYAWSKWDLRLEDDAT